MKKIIYIIVATILIGAIGYFGYQNVPGRNTGNSSESYFSESARVMYFYSSLCSTCQEQKNILTELAKEGYRVKSMDIEKNPEYVSKYKIFETPTFISDDGEKLTGLQKKEKLQKWLLGYK